MPLSARRVARGARREVTTLRLLADERVGAGRDERTRGVNLTQFFSILDEVPYAKEG